MTPTQNSGIVIEAERDAGSFLITYFSIIPGESEPAANYLLDLLCPRTEFYLSNDNDDGATSFRRQADRYESLSDGHGRSGDWTASEREDMVKKIKMLSQFNLEGGIARRAGIQRRKKLHTQDGARQPATAPQ